MLFQDYTIQRTVSELYYIYIYTNIMPNKYNFKI